MQLVIDIIRGALAGQRLAFPHQRVVSIGRDPRSDVTLDAHQDILASTRHAEVHLGPDNSLTYVDLGSSNGSFVNGARITQVALANGSEVELGAGGPLLRFTLEAAPGQQAALAPIPPPAFQPPPAMQPAPQPVAAPGPGPLTQPAPQVAAPLTPAAPAAPLPGGAGEAKVGARTVAMIVETAIEKERMQKPRSTEFFRTIVDKEVRAKNKGLFVVTIVLAVLLTGAVVGGVVFILRQRSDIADQERKASDRNQAHHRALAKAKEDTQAQMKKLRAEADKRQREYEAAIARLKVENEKIKEMAKDKGPQISQQNRTALYLLAYGELGSPRYATCTAFAVGRRVLGTNAHCVVALRDGSRRGSYFYAVQNENPSFKAKVEAVYQHGSYYHSGFQLTPDVGLVQVDRDLPKLVTFATADELKEVKRGSLMFSFGFPGRLADPRKPIATLVHGRIGRMTRYDASMGTFEQSQLLQHSALSMGGASGSPLFNEQGKVIGVHAGSYTQRSSETIFDPATRLPKRIMMAHRLGYKFGIRSDALTPLHAAPKWEKLEVRGVFATVKEIPKELLGVDCKAFARKLSVCSKGKVGRAGMESRCTIAKKIPTQSSVFYLTFAKCINAVSGCERSRLSRCITKVK
ncbi:MAG: trypsin-like peptidase domain-containing protein [bacterium]